MKKRYRYSPALKLIAHVAEHQGHQHGKSNIRRDHALDAALRLAITYGLEFQPEDFKKLADWYDGFASPVALMHPEERHYAMACGRERGINNVSAAIAYEKYMDRKPFLVRQSPEVKTPTRVYVGCQFEWHGQPVTCTSFKSDGSKLTACTYKDGAEKPACESGGEGGYPIRPQKIDRRFFITHDDIRDYHAALKSEAVA